MKTAKEWLDGMETAHTSCVYIDLEDIEAIQADAREQGRMEGLEEAAQACLGHETDPASWQNNVWDSARKACADAIRKLAEKSGGGDG